MGYEHMPISKVFRVNVFLSMKVSLYANVSEKGL
jgi:hypothetical protein